MTLAVLETAASGMALGAATVTLGLTAYIVLRLVREARATNSTRRKMPIHIMLVGAGVAVWALVVGDAVLDDDGAMSDTTEAGMALAGGLLLAAGLWKMVEVQQRSYTTLGNRHPPAPLPPAVERRQPQALGPDESEDSLPIRNKEGLARVRVEVRVFNAVLFVGLIFGLGQIERQEMDLTDAARDGCERINVLRMNQARVIQDEIDQTNTSLKLSLEALEPFRERIEQQQGTRQVALARLRRSVAAAGVRGDPYRVDCMKAYP